MSVYLDIATRLERGSAEAALAEAKQMWSAAGNDIGQGLSSALSRALGKIDGSAARQTLQELRAEHLQLAADAEEAHRRMNRSVGTVETRQRQLNETVGKYGDDSSRAQAATVALADAHALAARNTREHEVAAANAAAAHGNLEAAAGRTATSMSTMAAVANGVGIASIVGLTAAMAGTTEMAGNYQQAMTKMHAAADLPLDQVKQISDGILKMTGTVGYSASELQSAMFLIQKAGLTGANGAATAAEKLDVLRAAMQGAAVEGIEPEKVIQGLTTTMTNFHIPADQVVTVMSQLRTAVGESKVPLDQFAGTLDKIEPAAAAAKISAADLWGSLAQITRNGTTADQGGDWLANSIRSLTNVQGPARDAMQQLGINVQDVTDKLGDGPGGRGLAGTMQYLSDTVMSHLADANHVNVGELRNAAQAGQNANAMLDQMSPTARAAAEALQHNTMGHREYQMAVRNANEQDATRMKQFQQLVDVQDGFSKKFANGQSVMQDYIQLMDALTGTQSGAQVAFALTGDHAKAVNDSIAAINHTLPDAGNNVKGFNETQDTLNQKMKEANAAFGAAGIELGTVFIPVMTEVASGMKSVAGFMSEHEGLAEGLVYGLGGVATAWGAVRTAMMFRDGWNLLRDGVNFVTGTAWPAITETANKWSGVNTKVIAANDSMRAAGAAAEAGEAGVLAATDAEAAAEGRVATAAGEANAALSNGAILSRAAGPISMALLAGPHIQNFENDNIPGASFLNNLPTPNNLLSAASGYIQGDQHAFDNIGGGAFTTAQDQLDAHRQHHAAGGPVFGSGPKGRDSVPTWLAPGEHVLTAGDVDAMGGHSNVYAFRNALHRAGGGGIGDDLSNNDMLGDYGPDVQAAARRVGTAYSQALRNDCSGTVGQVVNEALGIAGNQLPTTANMGQWLAERGFVPGLGGPGDMSVGWYNGGPGGGHAAMTLSNGMNFEQGGASDYAKMGRGAAGAFSSEFSQHMHLPGGGGSNALFAAEERVKKLEDRISVLQEKIAEETGKTKQSEKDKLDKELQRAQEELAHAKDQLAEVERSGGGSGRGRGGRGGSGSGGLQFGAKLPDRMGLDKGIPGFFEWLTTMLADLAIGPIEGAMLGNAIRSGQIGADALGGMGDSLGGLGGGLDQLAGDAGVPLTALAGAVGPDGPSGGGGGAPAGGGSGGGAGRGTGGPAAPSGGGAGAGGWDGLLSSFKTTGAAPAGAPGPAGTGPMGAHHDPLSPLMVNNVFAGFPAQLPMSEFRGIPMDSTIGARNLGVASGSAYGQSTAGQGFMDALRGQSSTAKQNRDNATRAEIDSRSTPQDRANTGSALDTLFPQYHADGGPIGTDTVPAWLTPGEFVMNKTATEHNLDALKSMNAGHYDTGTQQPVQQGGTPVPKAPGPGGPQQQPGGKPGAPSGGQPHLTGNVSPGPGNQNLPGGSDTHPGLSTPGGSTQQFGEGLPASSGIGFGGGAIGFAEGAAAQAAGLAAGAGSMGGGGMAASQGLQAAFQALNRTAGYIGQVGGIAAEGIISTLLPADSPLSNFSNSLPGKLLAGVAGVRPGQPNSAGKTEAPMKSKGLEEDSRKGSGGEGGGDQTHIGMQVSQMTVHANNPEEFHQQLSRDHSAATAAYPTHLP